jgi:putative pyrroloquinoline-quinone-binding quinoprotein
MSRDRRQRSRSRELELEPSPDGYAEACQAALREGEPERARDYLRGALAEFPGASELLEVAALLSPGDPWPDRDGPGGRRASIFPGPERGVQRWRWELPDSGGNAPLVDSAGGVWVRDRGRVDLGEGRESRFRQRLVRVGPTGVQDAFVVQGPGIPRLEEGRPHCYDPTLGALSQAQGWSYVRSDLGEIVAWNHLGQLEGTGGGGLGWRRRLSNLWLVAAGVRSFLVLHSGGTGLSALDVVIADLETGKALAPSRPLEADFQASWYQAASFARSGEERYLISTGKRVGLYAESLEPVWDRALPCVKFACDGREIALAGEGGLRVLDLESGQVRWARPDLDVYGSPSLDGRGWVYVISGGALLCFDRSGERRFRVELGSLGPLSSPSLGGPGELYLCAGSSVVCIA